MAKRIVVALILITAGPACFATPADWASANQAYANGDFTLALQHFDAARRDGLDGPAVHYNIAVCYFKLAQYGPSRNEFQLIINRFPGMRGLAEYNLGLIDRRLNNTESAVGHFLAAHRQAGDDQTLRILASKRLRELEPEIRSAPKWAGAVGVRIGFDDNVALRDQTGLPSTVTSETPTTDLFASIKGPYNGVSGFRVDGSVYVVKNFNADEFDQSELQGGVMYDWRPGDWRLQVGLHGSAGSLGGDSFDRKFGGNFRAIRYLDEKSELGLSYSYDDVQDANSLFAGIGGSRQQLEGKYRWYSNERRFVFRFRHEENNRVDAQVSPTRTSLSLDYRFQPASGWGYEGGLSFRNSRFDETAVLRDEDLFTVRAALTRVINSNWLLSFNYQHSNNDSSESIFSYDRNIISVGGIRVF